MMSNVFSDRMNSILNVTKDEDFSQNLAKQADVKKCERQIDRMVYSLYGLTAQEVEIVENSNKE